MSGDLSDARKLGIKLPDDICYTCLNKARGEAGIGDSGNAALLEENEKKLTEILSQIRIITYPPDSNSKYEYCGLVTATSAIGIGSMLSG